MKANRVHTAAVVGALWGLHILWQLVAMKGTLLFNFGLPLEGVVSYCFGLGYVLVSHVGTGWSGPCPVSDGRWQVGVAVMLMLTILPFLCQTNRSRWMAYILLSAAHFVSALYTIENMINAIT